MAKYDIRIYSNVTFKGMGVEKQVMKPVLGKLSVVSLIWKSNYKKTKQNLENIHEPSNYETTKNKNKIKIHNAPLQNSLTRLGK